MMEKILRKIPAKRLGEAAEIAHLATALLDGENNFMTGEFLSLSGGWTSS
jgi:NAD(P)-dependent dehydrogenase (short-subunit alcohol dehydrogenase family)